MRLATFAALVLLVGCGPGIDPLIGSYTFNVTSVDTNTAPKGDPTTTTGTGTLAVTADALATGYVITAAQTNITPCVLAGTAAVDKTTDPTITITPNQTCVFVNGSTTTTATITSGTATLKLNATRPADVMTLNVEYSYAGTTMVLGVNLDFAGTGTRTYTGARR